MHDIFLPFYVKKKISLYSVSCKFSLANHFLLQVFFGGGGVWFFKMLCIFLYILRPKKAFLSILCAPDFVLFVFCSGKCIKWLSLNLEVYVDKEEEGKWWRGYHSWDLMSKLENEHQGRVCVRERWVCGGGGELKEGWWISNELRKRCVSWSFNFACFVCVRVCFTVCVCCVLLCKGRHGGVLLLSKNEQCVWVCVRAWVCMWTVFRHHLVLSGGKLPVSVQL